MRTFSLTPTTLVRIDRPRLSVSWDAFDPTITIWALADKPVP
jgi:hypothetical protein